MKKRSITLLALCLCLAGLLAAGSLAYFTATDSVSNRFLVATTDPGQPADPDALFSIRLYETDGAGQTETGKEYTNVQPGSVLDKDPTVENTGKYDQWVRLSVTVTNAAAWKSACEAHSLDLLSIFGGLDGAKWISAGDPMEDTAADSITYVYYLNEKLTPGATATLFTTVTLPVELTTEEMVSLSSFDIVIGAEALQADYTGDNAQAAFAACWE